MIIPQSNVATLMLDERVLQAVRAGLFHVYAVRQVDEALSLLVGADAGTPNADGVFPEGSVNARVVERLRTIAQMGQDDEPEEPPPAAAVAAKPARKKALKKPPVDLLPG